jgi:uncharacterized membrane protein YfcA
MTWPEILVILAAGVVAGAINAIVGSGSLITFPALLWAGFSPVTANVSNALGQVFGNASATWGYRRELKGQRRRCLIAGTGTMFGALAGGVLLLSLPDRVFEAVVPLLILLACSLMVLRPAPALSHGWFRRHDETSLFFVALTVGLYGGYFGAAQGVILLAALRFLIADDLQRLNGLKNVLVGVATGVAALLFVFVADVAWDAAALVAAGSILGAYMGARYGRRIPDDVLRWTVVIIGVTVAIVMLIR